MASATHRLSGEAFEGSKDLDVDRLQRLFISGRTDIKNKLVSEDEINAEWWPFRCQLRDWASCRVDALRRSLLTCHRCFFEILRGVNASAEHGSDSQRLAPRASAPPLPGAPGEEPSTVNTGKIYRAMYAVWSNIAGVRG